MNLLWMWLTIPLCSWKSKFYFFFSFFSFYLLLSFPPPPPSSPPFFLWRFAYEPVMNAILIKNVFFFFIQFFLSSMWLFRHANGLVLTFAFPANVWKVFISFLYNPYLYSFPLSIRFNASNRYEREIKELKAELAMHDTLSNKSHVQYETYTETQRNDLNALLRKYLVEEIDDIEVFYLPFFSSLFLPSPFRPSILPLYEPKTGPPNPESIFENSEDAPLTAW